MPALERAHGFISHKYWNIFQAFFFFSFFPLFPLSNPKSLMGLCILFIPISSNSSGFWTAKSRVKKQRVVGERTHRHLSASTDVMLNGHLKEFNVSGSFAPRGSSYPNTPAWFASRNSDLYVLNKENKLWFLSHVAGTGWLKLPWLLVPAVLWQFENHLSWLKCGSSPPQKVTWTEGQDIMGWHRMGPVRA